MKRTPCVIFLTEMFLAWNNGNVSAATAIFTDFSSTDGLTINANATATTTPDGEVMRLASASPWQSGSVFNSITLNAASFSTYFTFRLTNPGGASDGIEKGADGFAFLAQPIRSSLGESGGGLGYQWVSPSVGVEFDTFRNGWDTSSNHLGIAKNGAMSSSQTIAVAPKFDDGKLWYAWIDYNGTTLEVRANESGERPASALLSYDLDIPTIIGTSQAYVGFTAGTGMAYANHEIFSWEYRDSYKPVGTATPIPETAVLFGAGLLGLTMLKSRKPC